jgi:hypothetical protein
MAQIAALPRAFPQGFPRKFRDPRFSSVELVERRGIESNFDKTISHFLEDFGTLEVREPSKNIELARLSPSLGKTNPEFEVAIAQAILLAAQAGQFELAVMLARELEARRTLNNSIATQGVA